MSNIAQLDLTTRAGEARLRALLEDVVEERIGVRPESRLALAVWFGKGPQDVQNLLELSSATLGDSFASPVQFSLYWKSGSESPPFVRIHAASVQHFSKLLVSNREEVSGFFDRCEVLYFDKGLLTEEIIREFKIITAPPGLLEGWYINQDQYSVAETFQDLVARYSNFSKQLGLVKTWESPDFENSKGILHVEVGQRWLPLSSSGVKVHTFFNDLQEGRPGYFLFEGGSLYRVLKFEETMAPQYVTRVLERPRDDRYLEVYLRAVHPSEKSAA